MKPNTSTPSPPKNALAFLRWFCKKEMLEDVEGDLCESFNHCFRKKGLRIARFYFVIEVIRLFRPGIVRYISLYDHLNPSIMLKNHIKIGWRQLMKNKGYSLINIGGLAAGMAVTILIGLWIKDELSFNRQYANYDRIAQVMQHYILPQPSATSDWTPVPLAAELKEAFENDFEHVVISTHKEDHTISNDTLSFSAYGKYMQPEASEMLTMKMLAGSRSGLSELNSILLSQSLAKKLFGAQDPLDRIIKIDLRHEVKVTGVYQDFPHNSTFNEVTFIAPWDLYVVTHQWWKEMFESWKHTFVQVYVQLRPHSEIEVVSERIKNVIQNHREAHKNLLIETSLHPMSKWHLYNEFKDGKNTGGQIRFVWLFGTIGVFVLLLACINFVNLSTARAEGRTREVGIRKASGSFRSQLIHQFFIESLLVVTAAFILSIGLVLIALPWFNDVANKQMIMPWQNLLFWGLCLGFILITSVLAGSYPALYLSSFKTVKALKGTFRSGKFAAIPRRILVVIQFTVSVTLIIGTTIVHRQIQHSKDRPLGYDQSGLINLKVNTSLIHQHFEVIRNKLITSGVILDMAESSGSVTRYAFNASEFQWPGKDPDLLESFNVDEISPEYGNTIGWKIVEGRDFSRQIESDKLGLIVNESAVKMMALEHPVGETVKWNGKSWTILGVVGDMMVDSPYRMVKPFAYYLLDWPGGIVSLRLNPRQSTQDALEAIQTVFKEYAPGLPFDYKFIDQQYGKKFDHEVRIGKLASVFTILAIFISCLGLFGLASFMAKKRTKEFGVRKVVGASIFNLWGLMSKEFLILIFASCLTAFPIAFYFLKNWLEDYQYRTSIPWWIFIAASVGSMIITLFTVSFHAIKAATANPAKSLRSD